MKTALLALAFLTLLPFAAQAEEVKAAAPAPAAALATKWDLDLTKSTITFKGTQVDTPGFDGVITKFYPVINFDEANLAQSKVTVEIDVTSIDAKEAERNKTLQGADWLDSVKFPSARFETTGFTKTGDNAFEADATLTIRDATVPLKLPFTLTPAPGEGAGKVLMEGKATLDRSKFQLGQGDWADAGVIGNDIEVAVKLIAWPAEQTEAAPPATPNAPVTPVEAPPNP
jgi:polyisoprenoid-binding protein YceI